jgi:pullulanase/glycogen debranching enzyme
MLQVQRGSPQPLGASPGKQGSKGVNFAVAAPHATAVTLCLFDHQNKPLMETGMQKSGERVGYQVYQARAREGTWHWAW